MKDTIDFNPEVTLNKITLESVKDTLAFSSSLGDIIKWQLIGLYIQNDEPTIEDMHSMFTKNGAFHDRRAYKTEAQTVYKMLKNQEPINGTVYKLSDIAETKLEDRPFSVGVAYKNRPKAEPAPKDERLQAAKRAIKDDSIDTGPITNAKQLLELANMGIPEFTSALQSATVKNNTDSIKKEFMEFNTDNMPKIVAMMKEYLTELVQFPDEMEQITDHIMELQTAPVQESKVA